MSDVQIWSIMAVIGVGTFALRLSFIELIDRLSLPVAVRRGLRFVPPAVLAALVIPGIVLAGDSGGELTNPRLIAGIAAAVVAWYTRGVIWTLAVGMGSLWLLVWLGVGQ